jgi:predicted MFS family arabinose efflux permease
MKEAIAPNHYKRVVSTYFLIYVLNAPLFALYGLIPFILYRDLGASALPITLVVAMRPIVAVFSSYWSYRLTSGLDHIRGNLVGATLLGLIPTLLLFLYPTVWGMILSFALYVFAERAMIPALMEVIKQTCTPEQQSKVVARGGLVMFTSSAICPILLSPLLDFLPGCWTWLFPVLGILSALRIPLLLMLPILDKRLKQVPYSLLSPWKHAWKILRSRPDFAYYQLIFFLGGFGLMVMHPALPEIIKGHLDFSYTEIATAVALFKGVGFVLATPFWSERFTKTHIFTLCGWVTLMAGGSIALIFVALYYPPSIFMAYLLYGVMQAGSQLSWQMGGPLFSAAEDSSSFTSINVALVGVRGCIGPFLGGALCTIWSPQHALAAGMFFCFAGSLFAFLGRRRVAVVETTS